MSANAVHTCRLKGLTDDIEHETNETMVGCERKELGIGKDDMLRQWVSHCIIHRRSIETYFEVVDDGFTVQKVVGDGEEVPIERAVPRVARVFPLSRGMRELEERSDFTIS